MKKLFRHGVAQTCLGPIFIAVTERGLAALAFLENEESLGSALDELKAEFDGNFVADMGAIAPIAASIEAYGSGDAAAINKVSLDLFGTKFQLAVWDALRKIRPGQRRSYSELAAMMGRPSATRAVASAVAANRVALMIPCHRVVRKDGSVGEFRWGSSVKTKLLDHEQLSAERRSIPSQHAYR